MAIRRKQFYSTFSRSKLNFWSQLKRSCSPFTLYSQTSYWLGNQRTHQPGSALQRCLFHRVWNCMKSGFSVAMRTGASWAEAFFFFLSKDEKRRLYLNRVKPFEVAQKKTTLWANKSFSLLSNWFFLAWVTNVSARVNARTLEREQKKKKENWGRGRGQKETFFLSPPSLPNFFCSRNRFAERLATQARFFLVRVPVHWRTDGHKWGHCTKRTAVMPGVETISWQHTTHAQQRS